MCWIHIRQRFCTARRICGYVVFFRGLIDTTECPEELATVFAHEIGHVEARDPTRIALRSAGSIDVLGLLFGGRGGALVLLLANGLSKVTTPETPRQLPMHLPMPPCWTQTCRHLPLPHSFRDWHCKAAKMRALWST